MERFFNTGGPCRPEMHYLCVRWPRPGRPSDTERWAVELKVWRDGRPDPLPQGLKQLDSYLARLGLDHGTLILFDARKDAPPLPERCSVEKVETEARRVTVLRL